MPKSPLPSLPHTAPRVVDAGMSAVTPVAPEPVPLDIDLDALVQRKVWVLPEPVAKPATTHRPVDSRGGGRFIDSTPAWLDSVPIPSKSDDAQLSQLDSSPLVQRVIEQFLDEDRKAAHRVLALPLPEADSQASDQERRRAVLALVQGAQPVDKEFMITNAIQRNNRNSL
jgi:hypothetical protein